jgi:hypothetical protein
MHYQRRKSEAIAYMTEHQPKTTSHWAVSEECCKLMAEKYGWSLQEAKQRLDAKDPLAWECVFDRDAEFPKTFMDYTKGKDR